MPALYLLYPLHRAPSRSVSLFHHLGGGILASLAKIRMRLDLLTVEGKGLSSQIQKKTTSDHQRPGEIAEKKKKHIKTKTEEQEGGEDDTRKWREVKIILREFHLSTRRDVERRERSESEESGPASLPLHAFSLTHAPFASASLFVFTLGASRGGCVKARL